MTIKTNTFEGGTTGTAITTANSGGTSGTAFDAVANVNFTNARAAHGTLSAESTAAATGTSTLRWALASETKGNLVADLYLGAQATVDLDLLRFSATGDVTAVTARINSAGKLRLTLPGSVFPWTATNVFPINQWVRVELYAEAGTGTAGKARLAYYLGDSTTAVEDSGLITGLDTAAAVSGGSYVNARVGKLSTGSFSATVGVDNLASYTGTDAAFPVGPWAAPVTNAPPTANAGTDQTNVEPWSTVTLTGVDSDSDGTVASRVWTQTGGFLLTDDFATKDLSKWTWGAGVAVSGGRMVVTTNANYYGNTTGPLPLNSTAISVELVQVPVGPGFVDVYLGLLGIGANSNQTVSLDIESGTMKLYTNYGSGYALLASQAYSTVNHRFIRYRYLNRVVSVDTSADGITWAQWQAFTWTGSMLAAFTLGAGATIAVADTIFDNVRIGVPITNPTSATASFPAPATIAGTTIPFSYAVTDNLGAIGTDSVSVTVLPVTERAVIDGVEVPMQIRTT